VTTSPRSKRDQRPAVLDVLVIGAGFAGLYMLHKLRGLGYCVRIVETAGGLGGTWFWNCYPGARADVESVEYSYSFSSEIEQEWVWTELMSTQAEVERYLNFVADRLDLRKDIQLNSTVTTMLFDEQTNRWTVITDNEHQFDAQYVVAATGCLSSPQTPHIDGIGSFERNILFTSRFPRNGFDFSGKRAAIVGTGSSGVQAVPVVASQARHLTVFQRSAAYTRPARNRQLRPGELDKLKSDYPGFRERQRKSFAGVLRFGGEPLEGERRPQQRILDTPISERLALLDEMGWEALTIWADVMNDIQPNMEANQAATQLYAELIRRHVRDPVVAAKLVPHHPMGCKRQILDTGYFETFNRDNVELVDLRVEPIERIVPNGIRTSASTYALDVILFATGFNAMTGALDRINIRGRRGRTLRQTWNQGPRTYLGLQVSGFPNLFLITGPGSPTITGNVVVLIEQNVEWIARCMEHVRRQGKTLIEANHDSEQLWADHVASVASASVTTTDGCNSWFLGPDSSSGTRVFMSYIGGLPSYRDECDRVAAAEYEGFTIA